MCEYRVDKERKTSLFDETMTSHITCFPRLRFFVVAVGVISGLEAGHMGWYAG
jgi:hypothetical protein